MDKYIGRRLDGRYEVIELVGIGGMSYVYLGRDVTDEKPVAIKILRSEFAENEEFLRRFKNESKAVAMLSHDNIVKVYDVSFTERVHFIIMEYIDGITLKEYIEQQGVIDWKQAVHFSVQILKGLQHAHDKGIVHRDIKPQNMMLLPDGTIKITDFGIARFARSGAHTITDRAIGSVHYISPEQASGAATDQRTDIYSVGVMLFEMLTGKLPFDADTPISVALQQIQAVPLKPTQINADIPKPLEEIVIHAMQKDMGRRYQSAAEMINDFDEFKKNPQAAVPARTKSDTMDKPTVKMQTPENKAIVKPNDEQMPWSEKMKDKLSNGVKSAQNKKKISKNTDNLEEEKSEKSVRETVIPMVPVMAGITAAFALVSLTFVITMFYLNNPFQMVEDTNVPELIGMKYDALENSQSVTENFDIEIETTDYHPTYGAGVIYSQSPDPGRTVKVGSTIRIKVSSGQKEVIVPNVVGADAATAYEELDQVGLKYAIQEVFHDTMPVGTVVSLNPPPTTAVSSGTVIEVQVSIGEESKTVMVPALVGMKIGDAETLLENFKLGIGGQSYAESDLPRGTIIEQDPPQGSVVDEGAYINVVLSEGDGNLPRLRLTIPMPDIDRDVRVQAMVNGVIAVEEVFNPSEVAEWKPIFEGEGVVNIQIILSNDLYQEITLDFDNKTFRIEQDNSAEFDE